jgi:hypothetical protein
MRQRMLMAIMVGVFTMVSMSVVNGCYSKSKEEYKEAPPAESAAPPAEPEAPPAEPEAPPADGGDTQ